MAYHKPHPQLFCKGFSGGSNGKESACSAGRRPGLTRGWGRSPGEGNSNPFQCSCLGNPMDRRATVGYNSWGCKESDTTERLTLSLSGCWRFVQNFKNLKHPKYRNKNQQTRSVVHHHGLRVQARLAGLPPARWVMWFCPTLCKTGDRSSELSSRFLRPCSQ